MKGMYSILALKVSLKTQLVVYASYKNVALASLLIDTLQKWDQGFFFHLT